MEKKKKKVNAQEELRVSNRPITVAVIFVVTNVTAKCSYICTSGYIVVFQRVSVTMYLQCRFNVYFNVLSTP